MASSRKTTEQGSAPEHGQAPAPTYFERQRAALVQEIGMSLERVLQNFNKLNRTLEGVIDVGNEFGSVEALWSQFENVMAKEPDVPNYPAEEQADDEHQGEDVGHEEEEEEAAEERR